MGWNCKKFSKSDNKMNVLIINPPWEKEGNYGIRSNSRWPHTRKDKALPYPLYLGYAAAVLEKEGLNVKIIDCVYKDMTHKDFKKYLSKEKPDLCFIETSTPSIKQDLKALRTAAYGEKDSSRVDSKVANPILRSYFKDSVPTGDIQKNVDRAIRKLKTGIESKKETKK